MEAFKSNWVNRAFHHSFRNLRRAYGIPIIDLTIVVRFGKFGALSLYICKKEKAITAILSDVLMNQKMAGLGITTANLERVLKYVHLAFMKEQQVTEPDKISLILYESPTANCFCVGVILDRKAIKVMRLHEVLGVVGLGKEQLN